MYYSFFLKKDRKLSKMNIWNIHLEYKDHNFIIQLLFGYSSVFLIFFLFFRFGPRFPPMNKAYNATLMEIGRQVAEEMGISDIVHKGVYTCLGGPNFETVAELKMLRMVGVDAVGTSQLFLNYIINWAKLILNVLFV